MTWCQGTAPKPLWEDGVHTAPRGGRGEPAHETGVRHLRPRPLGASRSQRRPRRFAVGGQKWGVPQHICYFGEGAVSPQISPEARCAPRPCGRGVGLGSTAGSRRDFLAATTWHEGWGVGWRARGLDGRGGGARAGHSRFLLFRWLWFGFRFSLFRRGRGRPRATCSNRAPCTSFPGAPGAGRHVASWGFGSRTGGVPGAGGSRPAGPEPQEPAETGLPTARRAAAARSTEMPSYHRHVSSLRKTRRASREMPLAHGGPRRPCWRHFLCF